jgi:methyl acetate hydrolase
VIDRPDTRLAISDLLRSRVARGDVPAVVAAVAHADALPYLEAFGRSDVAANVGATPDTIFRIASMTKPVTSLAVMMLVEEGRVSLDDPIAAHLPDYHQPPVLTRFEASDGTYESRPPSRPILVRDLLTHTSGISYPFFHPALARLIETGTPAAALPLVHDPGAKWTYGPSTAILGRMVAHTSGATLDAFCRRRIFDPLGMADTAYAVHSDKQRRVATLHERNAMGAFVERPNPAILESRGRGDDGLFSTAHDYAAFLQMFLNGGRGGTTRLVGERTIRIMTSNQIGPLVVELVARNTPLVRQFPPGAGKNKFGFGFQIETEPTEEGMRGPGSLSWSGVFNTHFWIDPRNGLAAVVLMQLLPANDEKIVDLLRAFERLVYQ